MGASTSGQHAAGGMVKSLALQMAADGIEVNAVLSPGVDTHVIHKKAMCQVLRPHMDNRDQPRRHARRGAAPAGGAAGRLLRVGIVFLLPDRRGYLDGETLTVPGGLGANNATAGEPSDHLQAHPDHARPLRPPARRAGIFGRLLHGSFPECVVAGAGGGGHRAG